MAATSQQTESIKLIGEWSKWIATVETGAIALTGTFYKSSLGIDFTTWAFSIAILFFVSSITVTSGVLISLPAAVQDIEPGEKVWDRRATLGPFLPKLIYLVAGQFLLFVLGIIAFGCGIIASLFRPLS